MGGCIVVVLSVPIMINTHVKIALAFRVFFSIPSQLAVRGWVRNVSRLDVSEIRVLIIYLFILFTHLFIQALD
jgi:hypothetical protein